MPCSKSKARATDTDDPAQSPRKGIVAGRPSPKPAEGHCGGPHYVEASKDRQANEQWRERSELIANDQ